MWYSGQFRNVRGAVAPSYLFPPLSLFLNEQFVTTLRISFMNFLRSIRRPTSKKKNDVCYIFLPFTFFYELLSTKTRFFASKFIKQITQNKFKTPRWSLALDSNVSEFFCAAYKI